MPFDPTLLAYAAPALPIWLGYRFTRLTDERQAVAIRDEAVEAQLTEPSTLHPVIDTAQCIGCSSCVLACPEGDVLGLIDQKAQLIDPTRCIGHGACAAACPAGAIDLVFGTASRGVDIPVVDENFETNVPGIFLAGEIGGMGLIRNAIRQGAAAVESIAERCKTGALVDEVVDLVIVGAGPAGIAATLKAKELGLSSLTIEQEQLGGTVAHYPRGKLVMTEPARLPIYGLVKAREISKEKLLEIWSDVIEQTQIRIDFGERLERVEMAGGEFAIVTSKRRIRARNLLLAIGRRGTPRKLDVPGESMTKVVYRVVDPEQYRGKHVLVVGGGDSAVEAALAISEQADTNVVLSYRRRTFGRVRKANRDRIFAAASAGRLELMLNSEVVEIRDGSVIVKAEDTVTDLKNDFVVVCAGGVLPTAFLEELGVGIERKFGKTDSLRQAA